jgi:transmembrane sensor
MKSPLSSSSQTIDEIAARWVGRRDAGLSPAEHVELEQWRTADARHAEALDRFEQTWSVLAQPRQAGKSAAVKRMVTALDRSQRRRQAGVAVMGLIVCLTAIGLWRVQKSPGVVSPAPDDPVVLLPERQTLPDGSIVEYPRGAVLTIDFKPARRLVMLQRGEAQFEVTKDPARPFVVVTAGIEVRAVGTVFAVQKNESAVDVLVAEGRVAVEEPAAKPAGNEAAPRRELAEVAAGRRVHIGGRGAAERPVVVALSEREMAERLPWRSPRVEFSGTPLAKMVESINRFNRTQLVIDDPELGAVALSGLFRADDLEAVVQMLEEGFGVKAERRAGKIFLRKVR